MEKQKGKWRDAGAALKYMYKKDWIRGEDPGS
jgi:hypothetical protein